SEIDLSEREMALMRFRVELESLMQGVLSFIIFLLSSINLTQTEVGGGKLGIDFDAVAQFPFGFIELTGVHIGCAQKQARLEKIGVKIHGLLQAQNTGLDLFFFKQGRAPFIKLLLSFGGNSRVYHFGQLGRLSWGRFFRRELKL